MKKTHKRITSVLLGALLTATTFSLAGCGSGNSSGGNSAGTGNPSSENTEKTYEMQLVYAYGEQTITGKNMLEFECQVEELTSGRVQVVSYPNGQITSPDKELSLVKEGTVQASYSAGGSCETINPLHAVYTVPFLMTSIEAGDLELIRRAYQSEAIEGPIKEYASELGYKLLCSNIPTLQGNWILANNKRPVEKPSAAAGLKIRVPSGKMFSLIIESMGASTTTIPGTEVPIALSQGVVDGTWGGTVYAYEAQWITNYITYPYCSVNVSCLYVNQDWWNTLPEDLQKIIEEEAIPATLDFAYAQLEKYEVESLQKLQDEYNVKPTWWDMQDPEIVSWISDVQKKGIDIFVQNNGETGQAMIDAALALRKEIGLPNYQ